MIIESFNFILCDVRKLIQFGLLNHLIRRIHQYPVLISTSQHIPVCDFFHQQLDDNFIFRLKFESC